MGVGANRPQGEKSAAVNFDTLPPFGGAAQSYDVVADSDSDAVSLAVDCLPPRPRPNCFANAERRSLYAGATMG